MTIPERIAAAERGENPHVITRLRSGWLTLADAQPLRGWCVLIATPSVPTLNDLDAEARGLFLEDMARVGDVLLAVTGAVRINYAIFGNQDPQLHAHMVPRYAEEPAELRKGSPFGYPWEPAFDPGRDGPLMAQLRERLQTSDR